MDGYQTHKVARWAKKIEVPIAQQSRQISSRLAKLGISTQNYEQWTPNTRTYRSNDKASREFPENLHASYS